MFHIPVNQLDQYAIPVKKPVERLKTSVVGMVASASSAPLSVLLFTTVSTHSYIHTVHSVVTSQQPIIRPFFFFLGCKTLLRLK
jgi:hypothetical protein